MTREAVSVLPSELNVPVATTNDPTLMALLSALFPGPVTYCVLPVRAIDVTVDVSPRHPVVGFTVTVLPLTAET